MLPPNEGLNTGDESRFEIDLGLVMKQEFVALKNIPQLALEGLTLDGMETHFPVKELVIVAPVFLGVIHRRVGILDQRVSILAGFGECTDPDACGDVKSMFSNSVNLFQFRDDLFSADGGIGCVSDFRKQDHKFIPALAADRVRFADTSRYASGYGLKEFVTDSMPKRVVDALEPVQIQEEDSHLMLIAAGQRDGLGDPIFE